MPLFTVYQTTQDAQMFTMLACCFLYHVHSNAAPGVRRINQDKEDLMLWVVNMSMEQKQGRHCSKEDMTL